MQNVADYEIHTPKRIDLNWVGMTKKLLRNIKWTVYGQDISEYYNTNPNLNFCRVETESLEQKFNRLFSEWQKESMFFSSMMEMAMLPSYQEIIGMGQQALPMILRKLNEKPDHLFWALRSISGEDPVPLENRGYVDRMGKAWIDWGRKKGIID